jgi:hypothetical protein
MIDFYRLDRNIVRVLQKWEPLGPCIFIAGLLLMFVVGEMYMHAASTKAICYTCLNV